MTGLTAYSPERPDLRQAFAYCERLARDHYENFTVASWFLPKRLRPSLYSIYAYCRLTDDLGDEAPGDRLAHLDDWEEDLRRCDGGEPRHPALVALQATIHQHAIPLQPFLDLIEANRMDQRVAQYATFQDLLAYCRFSANPVGRMVLHVFGYAEPARQALSDSICTGLQLANFWQDVRRDLDKGRVYLPVEDMKAFGYSLDLLKDGVSNQAFRNLIAFEVARTRQYFQEGKGLLDLVAPELRIDLRLFILGGEAVLSAIERMGWDTLSRRPSVGRAQKARLVAQAAAGLVGQRLQKRRHP